MEKFEGDIVMLPIEKADVCQISLTGARGLTMLGLLVQAPRTFEEIRQKYQEAGLMDKENSDDVIRIDMNTLRSIGCKISRSSIKTGHKYVLSQHPFAMVITKEEINLIKKAYKFIKNDMSCDLLIKYHNLFLKLSEHVSEETREQLLGISVLKSINIDLVQEINEIFENNEICKLGYQSGSSLHYSEKNLIIQKLELRNDKLYLLGQDLDNNESVMLPVSRITKIISRQSAADKKILYKPVEVKFILKNFNAAGMEKDEEIIETKEDSSYVISGKYHNEFIAVQRMLSLGSACIVLEPENIRQKVIEKLLAMREVYKND